MTSGISGHAHLWYRWPTCTIESVLVYPNTHSISCLIACSKDTKLQKWIDYKIMAGSWLCCGKMGGENRCCFCWFFSEPMPRVVAAGGDSEPAGCSWKWLGSGWLVYEVAGFYSALTTALACMYCYFVQFILQYFVFGKLIEKDNFFYKFLLL